VLELAKRERVPARIAKGDLEGKMRSRIWRKLHAEEAKRFDQAYALMEKTPGLSLPDAFGLLQSGMTLEEFYARKERTQKKQEVKSARGSASNEAIDAFLGKLREEKAELAVVLGERTLLDVLTDVRPVAFMLEKGGRVEKLQVTVLMRRSAWEQLSPSLDRDARLAQKPTPVAREPERRPYSDPREFQPQVGNVVELQLRNGIALQALLVAVGSFDLLLREGDSEFFVPIHALLRWSPRPESGSPGP
jgi:sRNA-binding regulator protein Hfq